MAAKQQDDSSQDASLLRRRARRRLLGSIALVLLAVIVLPLIFDQEPRPIGQDLVIQIPSQDGGKFTPRAAAPEVKADAPRSEAKPAAAAPAPSPAVAPPPEAERARPAATAATSDAPAKPASADTPKAASVPTGTSAASPSRSAVDEAKRAQAILDGGGWVVPLGAYLNTANVKTLQNKADAAGYASYSEKLDTPKGEQIRVRAGPFSSRAEAEKARDALKAAGLPADNPVRR